MIFRLVFILIFTNLAQAKELPIECKLQDDPSYEKVNLGNIIPEYFFKPIPRKVADTRNEVAFIGLNGNYILDMNTGTAVPIPGPYDAVPTPDGEFIVIPSMVFYDREGLNLTSKPLFEDIYNNDSGHVGNSGLGGVYHSMGVLEQNSNTKTYRAITDTLTPGGRQPGKNLFFKDYLVTINEDGTKKFGLNNNTPLHLCSNIESQMKLPMLSKNGKMIAAYDADAGSTKIYDIVTDEEGNSICNLKVDLGFATSKVEFSPDGENITFAMDSMPTTPASVEWYIQPPINEKNMNVFVFNLANKDLKQITKLGKGNAYYPSFSHDGSVVYLSQETDEKGDVLYFINRTKIDDGNETIWINPNDNLECLKQRPNFLPLLALGQLWYDTCQQIKPYQNPQLSALVSIPAEMDPLACQELVSKYWNQNTLNDWTQKKKTLETDSASTSLSLGTDEYIKIFQGLSLQDVLAVCPTSAKSKKQNLPLVVSVADETRRPTNPIDLCLSCHMPNSSQPIDFENPNALWGMKKKIQLHVLSGFMPRGMDITPERRQEILDWIEKTIPDDKPEKSVETPTTIPASSYWPFEMITPFTNPNNDPFRLNIPSTPARSRNPTPSSPTGRRRGITP